MEGKKNLARRAQVRELIEHLSPAEIADRLGISRQRVYQILSDEKIDYLPLNRRRRLQRRISAEADRKQVLLAVAAMHDRAARRARRDGVRRLVHEEAALHLRAISDDPETIAALVAGVDKTELTAGDLP